jgi:hypothetical protein
MDLTLQLAKDLRNAERDLAEVESRAQQLRWQRDYLKKLLAKAQASGATTVSAEDDETRVEPQGEGVSIYKASRSILHEAGRQLSIPQITSRLLERGFFVAADKDSQDALARNVSSALSKASKKVATGIVRRGRGVFELVGSANGKGGEADEPEQVNTGGVG